MRNFTALEISTYYQRRVPGMPQGNNREWRGRCPIHDGQDSNFAVNSENGLAWCHSRCRRGWDIISLEMELGAMEFIAAKASVYEIIGRPETRWEDRDVEATYDYTD